MKEEIENLFWEHYENDLVLERGFNREKEKEVWERLSQDEDLIELLKALMSGDRTRYFKASSEEQRISVKGAYLRTAYFLRELRSHSEKKGTKESRSLGTRYM